MLSRRTFLKTGTLAATWTSIAPAAFTQAAPCSPLVHTSLGTLRGDCSTGVRVFRGVPFAAPPIGPLRFRPPAPLQRWTGERDATKFSAAPLQVAGREPVQHSEDCLYLNIWTPAENKPDTQPAPVFVWIHGGGFVSGHAFEAEYDGSQFAREGIVCVTVGYRLGVLGFLDVEPALGSSYAGSANNAIRDLIAALTWIREHIADFGGDPARVTIGGESAGAKLADILMGIPAATPLFHQVISESGGAERVLPHATALTIGTGFASTFHQAVTDPASTLLTATGDQLITAQQNFMRDWPMHFPLRPELDSTLIPRLPIQSIAAGSSKGKRLLLGTNREESALFIGPHPMHDATPADLGNLSQPAFDAVYQHYAQLYPDLSVEQRRIRALTAEEYWIPSLRVADAHVAAGGSAFVYRLGFTESEGRLSGYAYHSLDVGLVWDKPHTGIGDDAQEAALATSMHTAWAAFIRGDTPSAPALPTWPAYDPTTRRTMVLDTQSRVEDHPQQAEFNLWNSLL